MSQSLRVADEPTSGVRWSQIIAPICAAALGLFLLYGAGLAQVEEIHNAAHDARHAAGFPCH